MGSSGERHKGRDHLPKVGSDPKREMAQDRAAVEENLGLRPGSATARIVGAVLVIAAVVAILALVVLN
ncbi:MAG: hypothetical protein M3011_14125 [Actinomycetota bacterium]|nr:hypothetical protein [Actinomycetota bacterium]